MQKVNKFNPNSSREYFSIGDPKKISKYLFKIEQVIIKDFDLGPDSYNYMQHSYENHKGDIPNQDLL